MAWAKPYVRSVRQDPGPVFGPVVRTTRRMRRRIARSRHQSIPIVDLRPAEVRDANLHLVLDRLERHGVSASVVRGPVRTRTYVAVGSEHRDEAARALASGNSAPHLRVQILRSREVDTTPIAERSLALASLASATLADDVMVLRVFAWHDTTPDTLTYGPQYACDVEFWPVGADGWRVAPRPNAFASRLSPELFEPVTVGSAARTLPVARGVRDLVTLDDIDFPIDAVVVWRADDVTSWPVRPAHRTGVPADEMLRFTLRSLDMYAPWLRRVHLVTDSSPPSYVVPDERLVVVGPDLPVDHGAIDDPSIDVVSRLDALAEHFVYLDGTSLLVDDVPPDMFFTPAGQIKVLPALVVSPIGPVTSVDDAHDAGVKRAAELVERAYARRARRATRRAPHALTRSLVRRALDECGGTAGRAHDRADDASGRGGHDGGGGPPVELVAHHLALITGEGVSTIAATLHCDLGTPDGVAALRSLAVARGHRIIGFADLAPGSPVPTDEVCTLLGRLLPVRSRWER